MAWQAPDAQHELRKARQRVGSDPASRMRWLLRLESGRDYGVLPEPDRNAFRWELEVFLNPAATTPVDEHRATVWYSKLRKLMKRLSEGRATTLHGGQVFTFRGIGRNGEMEVKVDGNPNYAIVERLRQTFAAAASHLRLCPAQGCQRPFIRSRRQIYCSSKCGSNTRVKKHRQKKYTSSTN